MMEGLHQTLGYKFEGGEWRSNDRNKEWMSWFCLMF